MRHHHHHHHRHHGSRFFNPLYWITGLAIIEVAFWVLALEVVVLWWVLWLAARGATIATQAMWEVTQEAGTAPDWQRAIDGARPPWPKRQRSRVVTR